MRLLFFANIVGLFLISGCEDTSTVFTRLSPDQTGVSFVNTTGENDTFNILTNEYIYNGGGVGIGDFNADGKPDIFFSGSHSTNELYLNEGDFKFKNVSEKACIGGGKSWNNGVTIVDINNDGFDDIYVCSTLRGDRKNQFYLNEGLDNDGTPIFRNAAAEMGIDNDGHNTQAAWLDYDGDGDLDLFLLVNEMVKTKTPNSFSRKVQDGSGKRTDKLFRQDKVDGKITFTDVGKETGILLQGFGLGVTVCDLNSDGWPDLYVTNDYLSNDIAYLNTEVNGQRKFVDISYQILKHTSYSAMGNDVVDVNNDGLPDIIAVDMLPADNHRRKLMLASNNYTYLLNLERFGYLPQFTRNTLQLSQGTRLDSMAGVPLYAETAMQSGLPATDWSWTPLVADFDLDGDKDVVITNGFPRDITDHDFGDYNMANSRFFSIKDLLIQIPSVKIPNVAFRLDSIADGIPQYTEVSKDWGIDVTSFSNGAAYADLDGDGDLDYVVNNIDDPAHLYRNNTISESSDQRSVRLTVPKGTANVAFWGAQVKVSGQGNTSYYYWHPHRGYLSSNTQDLIVPADSSVEVSIRWPGETDYKMAGKFSPGTTAKLTVGEGQIIAENTPENPLLASLPSPNFQHEERDFVDFNVQPMLLRKLSEQGPALAVTDWNNDGIEDVFVSGSFGKAGRWLQGTGTGFAEVSDRRAQPDYNEPESLGSLFFDADGDGDDDLYVLSGSYEMPLESGDYRDRFYRNDNGVFVQDSLAIAVLPAASGSAVRAADYDLDGDLDLFVGTRLVPHDYPTPAKSFLLRNDSKAGEIKFTIVDDPALESITNVTDALFTDYDNDGRPDLLVAGEWQPLRLFRNTPEGFVESAQIFGSETKYGWWNSLTAGDFDNDGDTDYIAGNFGHNSIIKPTAEEPLLAAHVDLDGNGTRDFAPFTYLTDKDGSRKSFPFFNRSDFAKQVSEIKSEYGSHTRYAAADRTKIMAKHPDAELLRADYFTSVYLKNTGDGLVMHPLPEQAQAFPIFGMLPIDANDDDFLDLLVIGNDHGNEVGQGFMDAGNGLLLLGDGNSGFTSVSAANSGFAVPGEGRAIVRTRGTDGYLIVAAQNSGPLVLARTQVQKSDKGAKKVAGRKVETYYGSGYLSQSGRR